MSRGTNNEACEIKNVEHPGEVFAEVLPALVFDGHPRVS